MKKNLLAVTVMVFVTAATVMAGSITVFAGQSENGSHKAFYKCFMKGTEKNFSAEKLEEKKKIIQKMVQEGKLTQEEANKKIEQIDARVKEINEFNSLTLEKKKEKLLKEFKDRMDQKVKDGKINQEKADKMLSDFKAKVDKWDGTGNPAFHAKGLKGCKGFEKGICRMKNNM
ncbi:MAG: YckD family protein [Clostridia bacterium]|nr:YckD family protein [Clostridia bacterium]